MIDWVDRVCRVPVTFRAGNVSVHQLLVDASLPLSDRAVFLGAVKAWLRDHPEWIDEWRAYSEDKRTSRGPYFGTQRAPLEVGFLQPTNGSGNSFSAGARRVESVDVRPHIDPIEACADFIYREAVLVLTGQRTS